MMDGAQITNMLSLSAEEKFRVSVWTLLTIWSQKYGKASQCRMPITCIKCSAVQAQHWIIVSQRNVSQADYPASRCYFSSHIPQKNPIQFHITHNKQSAYSDQNDRFSLPHLHFTFQQDVIMPIIVVILIYTTWVRYDNYQMMRILAYQQYFSSAIKHIKARQIFDSRGNPTIEADVVTDLGVFRAAVPSGASTGKYEALELRDGNKEEYMGKGVSKAVNNVNNILSPALKGKNPIKQTEIDNYMVRELDGTFNDYGYCKNKIGANAILSVSLAIARAGAAAKNVPLYQHIHSLTSLSAKSKFILPTPAFNVINGGKHGGNGLAMQEFMILPTGAKSFTEAMKIGSQVYHHLMKIIKKKYGLNATNVGDEGGFAPTVNDGEEALELLQSAIKSSGHQKTVQIGMDCAASEFYNESTKKYDLHFKDEKLSKQIPHVSSVELSLLYEKYASKYPIVSIEDPFDQDDWEGYRNLTAKIGEKVQIVGDDLLVTNQQRIKTGIAKKSCNALLLKVNQIGTLSESIQAYEQSKDYNWGVMVSHRSGETEDSFIADLVVGLSTGQIKTGAPSRSERLAKYNQLLRIEEQLGDKGIYAGNAFRYPYKLLG